jgi:hypothetical protein
MEANKSGKVKLTFELEINEPAMDLIKQNMEMMTDVAAQGMQAWRENMGQRGKQGQGGHGMGMMMHHGQGQQ